MYLELAKHLYPSLSPAALIRDEVLYIIWTLLYPADKCWQQWADHSSKSQMNFEMRTLEHNAQKKLGHIMLTSVRHWFTHWGWWLEGHNTQRASASSPNFGFPELLLLPSIWNPLQGVKMRCLHFGNRQQWWGQAVTPILSCFSLLNSCSQEALWEWQRSCCSCSCTDGWERGPLDIPHTWVRG